MVFNKRKNIPKFAQGDRVIVKSREQITKSLQPDGKLDGCLFTDQMWDYCGNTFTVLKVVDYVFNERRKRTFRTRVPLYLLENVVCHGGAGQSQPNCDHSCFIFWHEDWLTKVQ